MTTPIIKIATVSDEAPTIAAVVLAFSTDPATRWTWPDPNQYLTHFPSFVRVFGGQAFVHESAYYVDGFAGAALWLPPEVHPDEDALVTLLQRTGAAQMQKDSAALFEQMGSHHPREPHWYLPFIGVDPFHQGKGYGAALMQHALIPCDRGRQFFPCSVHPDDKTRQHREKYDSSSEAELRCAAAAAWALHTPEPSNQEQAVEARPSPRAVQESPDKVTELVRFCKVLAARRGI